MLSYNGDLAVIVSIHPLCNCQADATGYLRTILWLYCLLILSNNFVNITDMITEGIANRVNVTT